ncbi:hypothetical protein EDD58_105147 [Hazenella coriacea]|uniref:Uncharacterized protein n=2 Tax=Hazenella coriacea TaxID=1179467 RepID=A0A4R3L8V4_9BACL|nr:hypothetical protein EDD58_105147 [Hazenella coriacea]
MIFIIFMILTTCRVPDIYGRWSLEKFKSGCPQEIRITKVQYRSAFTIAEKDNATLYTYYSDSKAGDSPTYSLNHLDGDLYALNPYIYENVLTGFVPKYMKVSLTFEGRKLIFRKEHEKSECKYKLEADYQHIGEELFGIEY